MASALPKLTEVLAKVHRSGILELRLNTPQNLNSMTAAKYKDLIAGFDYAKEDPNVKAVVVTAEGRFFSSGAVFESKEGVISTVMPRKYVDALIDFPKLIASAVQGPAYGIAVSTLPLYDLAYASPQTTLTAPFSRIGVCLEGLSSTTLPPLLGPSLTSRLLYLSQTITMAELEKTGLFAEVLPQEGMQEAVIEKIEKMLEGLVPASIVASKGLVRNEQLREHLKAVNKREMDTVDELCATEGHFEAVRRFNEEEAAKKMSKAKL